MMNAAEKAAVLRQVADELDPPAVAAPAPAAPPALPALFLKPFSPRSLCNARPDLTGTVLFSPYVLPPSVKGWDAVIAGGSLSTTAYLAKPTDGPVTVSVTSQGLLTIPHWPSNTVPASGGDGHADVIDVAGNKIHSFWQLMQNADASWKATHYGATALDGSGWDGDGGRATGVSSIAMLIRKHEQTPTGVIDHVLAMSLPRESLCGNPAWIPPAKRADEGAATIHTGGVPEGALMMLPPDFPVATIVDPMLRKIATALQGYGARVVDENDSTPFVFYGEGDWRLYDDGRQFDLIRTRLRWVTRVARWLDANGQPFVPKDSYETAPATAPAAGVQPIAYENNTFTSPGAWFLYGANGRYNAKWLPPGTHRAINAVFGDPIGGTPKAVYPAL